MDISYDLKKRCVEAYRSGKTKREIYNEIFHKEHATMSLSTFNRKIQIWNSRQYAERDTLDSGTYEGFIAHGATVQVSGSGEIVQAWIKQHSDINWDDIVDIIGKAVKPYEYKHTATSETAMLEIPLFDMHFGVASLRMYEPILNDIIGIIQLRQWEQINILIGQDLIHNNDMRGHTAKGTQIETVSIESAWADAWRFWCSVIMIALAQSKSVRILYSKGNHDECISWCFVKALEAQFPQVRFDDALKPRKCITWQNCFIGYGHCEYTNNKDKLFRDFVTDFPTEYAGARVREIHCGHLHSESSDNGIMIRRLASAVPTDEWSSNNGFVGSHKRFQIFEWMPGRLKAIHYV